MTTRNLIILCIPIWFFSFAITPAYPADSIQVGIGKTDITPNTPMQLYGYSVRKGTTYTSIFDSLYCRSIVFDDGQSKAAIISLDSGTIPMGHWPDTIRKRLTEEFGIDYMFLTATHSHAAPILGKIDDPTPWNETIAEKIYQSIEQALSQMQPVCFQIGVGEADITYDRRLINEDGSVTMLWSNFDRKFTQPIDQRIHVLQIRNMKEELLATVVHYACHPVISGGRSQGVSADIPGIICADVNKALDGECIFLQGGCGDINPYFAGYLQEDTSAYEKLVEEGGKAARKVIEIAQRCVPIEQDDWTIRYQQKPVSFGLRHPLSDSRITDRLNGFFSEEGLKKFLDSKEHTLEADVSILMLGNSIAWGGFPGEFFDDFQVDLLQKSPVKHTFFVGYTNGMYSYFPSIEAAAQGGYGADYGLLAEAGTGDRMVDQAVIGIYQLLGKL